MILFSLISFSLANDNIKSYAMTALPKVLCFEEELKNEIEIISINKIESGNIYSLAAKSGSLNIKSTVQTEGDKILIVWAETDSDSKWTYEKPDKKVIEIAKHYMEMLINSIDPPNLIRVTSHRRCSGKKSVYHQMTLVTELHERRTLQFLEFKFKEDGKHSFVQHDVLLKDGEVF